MKVALVTGASTGLGLAISRRLIKENLHLILTARASSIPRFESEGILESGRMWIRPLDTTDAEQRVSVVEEANAAFGGIDFLINNAGIAYRAVVEHVSESERLHQMRVNFSAPIEMARLVLPRMREKCWGRIINISSVGGMMAMPTMAVYSASKFALEGASESLYYEVKPWGICVTLVQPGFIRSDSFERVPYTELSKVSAACDSDPYHSHYRSMESFVRKMMTRSWSTPDGVARQVVRVMKHSSPPLRVSGTLDARLFYALRRALPRKLYHWILYRNLPSIETWGPRSACRCPEGDG